MQNTPHTPGSSMPTSTKVALGILLGGVVLSCIVAVVWESRGHSGADITPYDSLALDTAGYDPYLDYPAEIVEVVETAEAEVPFDSVTVAEAVEAAAPAGEQQLQGYITNGGTDYPIVMQITLRHSRDEISGAYMWRATGKYAYLSTLERYGRGPSSWFTFTGHGPGNSDRTPTELTLKVKHPEGYDFEQWTLKPASDGFKGDILNLNTFDIFPVVLTRQ